MMRRLARRAVSGALLVLIVASAALVLTRLSPGDYATDLLGFGSDPEALSRTREYYGLDRPLLAQYVDWLQKAVRLDFGVSLMYGRPVSELVGRRALNTAILGVSSLLLATCLGVPLGVFTATRRGFTAAAIKAISVISLSIPPLLTSLLLVLVAARTGWLPIGGMSSAVGNVTWTAWTVDLLRHLPLPALALAMPMAAVLERLQAAAMTDALREPFALAVLGRGVSRARLVWWDVLRAAVRPVLATWGVIVGSLLSGSFVVEIVTAWPGLGRLMFDALRARDVYLVAGCATAGAVFVAVGNLVADSLSAAFDPRLRQES